MAAGKKKPEEMNPDTPPEECSLRDSAEEQLAHSPKHSPELKGKTSEQFIHELQVHQIELEMQAEELRRAHLALEESRDKFSDLYDFAPTGYITLTDKALIAEVNLAGATLLGVERSKLVNARFRKFIAPEFFEQWDEYFVNLLKQEEKQTCTLTLKRSDGSTVPARMEGIGLTGSGGVTTVRIALSDISDIWEIEALKNEYSILNGILESTDAAVFSLDRMYRYTSFNSHHARVMKQLYGADIKPGHSIFDYQTVKEDQVRAKHNIDRALAGEHVIVEAFSGEEGRSRRYFKVTHYPIKDTGKKVIGVAVFAQDITGQKQSEAELIISQQQYRDLFENVRIGILRSTPGSDGSLIEANPAAIRIFEADSREQLLKVRPSDLYLDRNERRRISEEIVKKGAITDMEVQYKTLKGRPFWGSITSSKKVSETGQIYFDNSIQDISGHKRLEEALKASEETFHSMFERHDSVMLLIEPETGNITDANLAAERFYGRSQNELRSLSIDEINIMSPEDIAAERMKAAREQKNFFRFRHRLASGTIRTVEVHSTPIHMAGKTILFSIISDITDRVRAEEALQLTLSRLESAMEAGNIAWWEMDCTTGNVSFSDRKARMLGYPAEQFSHYTDFTTLLHPDDAEPAMQAMRDHLSGLKKQYDVEYRIRTRDGGYRGFHDIGRISEYAPDGKPLKVTGLVIDITERKQAEEAQVKTTRKLNVLSDLTRKDLTSQIFVLNGYLNLAKKHADDQDQIIKTLSKGDRALRSIQDIIEYTKDYQDMGIKPATWQNMNLALLFGLSHVSIGEIQHSLETENIEIFADPLLEKVCQRLFENSLAHGGHVTRIRVWHTKTPDGITIFFEDDGVGISAEKKEQIFLRAEDTTRFSMRSLIFAREILDITGITIRETGEPGKGARFEMAVPDGAWRSTGKGD